MYPPPKPPEPSKLDARDAVELINELILLHINNLTNHNGGKIELLNRQLTDYLLAIDPRPGLYFKAKND